MVSENPICHNYNRGSPVVLKNLQRGEMSPLETVYAILW